MLSEEHLVSIDFSVVPPEEAVISVYDRGFLFGDSVYEVVRAYGSKPYALDRHFQRLVRSAGALGFDLPFDCSKLEAHFDEMVRRLGEENCYLRVIVTRGAYDLSLYPPDGEVRPTTVIVAGVMKPWPSSFYQEGINLVIVGIRRNPPGSLNPRIKSGNYLNNVLAAMEARRAGAVDAVMLSNEGYVTESSTANIFLVKDNTLITPPEEVGILDGVSRYTVMELASKEGIPVTLKLIKPGEFPSADECFLTSTTREVMPVRQVDDVTYHAPGLVTSRMMALYREYVRQ